MEQTPIEQLISDLKTVGIKFDATKYLAAEKEWDKQIAAKAFDAGFERGASVSLCALVKLESIIPNKEEYLSSLTK